MINSFIASIIATSLLGSGANLYPKTTVVIDTNPNSNVVTTMDFNGHEWQFIGVEDWNCGDIYSMIMFDNGTEQICDDIIISTQYSGWVDGNWGYDGTTHSILFECRKD